MFDQILLAEDAVDDGVVQKTGVTSHAVDVGLQVFELSAVSPPQSEATLD